jgi:hypothetical protein
LNVNRFIVHCLSIGKQDQLYVISCICCRTSSKDVLEPPSEAHTCGRLARGQVDCSQQVHGNIRGIASVNNTVPVARNLSPRIEGALRGCLRRFIRWVPRRALRWVLRWFIRGTASGCLRRSLCRVFQGTTRWFIRRSPSGCLRREISRCLRRGLHHDLWLRKATGANCINARRRCSAEIGHGCYSCYDPST